MPATGNPAVAGAVAGSPLDAVAGTAAGIAAGTAAAAAGPGPAELPYLRISVVVVGS